MALQALANVSEKEEAKYVTQLIPPPVLAKMCNLLESSVQKVIEAAARSLAMISAST